MMILLLALFSVIGWNLVDCRAPPKVNTFPLECMLRQFNFTVNVTDDNGRKCRGFISTKACYGSCESYEYGTFEFPYVVSVTPVCNYDEKIEVTKTLTDCDPDVDPSARMYRYTEALSCACNECDGKKQKCNSLMKRGENEDQLTSVDGQFGDFVVTKKRKGRKHRRNKPKSVQLW